MLRSALLGCFVFASLAISQQSCHAALVMISGTLTTGTGTFGAISPGDDFSLGFDFSEISPGVGSIDSGFFSSVPANLTITGGDITLIDNGANDIASFQFQTAGPSGTLSVAFLGDGLANNRVTSDNLIALINAASPAPISGNFAANGNFTGSAISAVPEPCSATLLSALATLAVGIRRRRSL